MEKMGEIASFYREQNVLITGATGFLGKGLVEKLLRSCGDLDKIYILIREKGERTVQNRLAQLLDSPLFEKLKNENMDVFKKLCPIEGNIGLPNLGLKMHDRNELLRKINVVIHCAATVRFDEPFEHALQLNVLGVKRIVELCKQMTNLKALVHVSTAYSNCDQRGLIEEKVYPPPPGGNEIIHLLKDMDRVPVDFKVHDWNKSRPNTYTYTKALAENYLVSEAKSLPVCIVRPSIVTASFNEPVPGWVDNVNGATGMIAGVAVGALRLVLLDTGKHINIIPVDFVVNAILCAGRETALQPKHNFPKVYNCCAPEENQVRYKKFVRLVHQSLQTTTQKYHHSNLFWNNSMSCTTNRIWYLAYDTLFRFIPALFVDVCMSTISKNGPGLCKAYWKLKTMTKSLEFFTLNEWQFATDNLTQLFKNLSKEDQKRFFFDFRVICWSSYMKTYCDGIKKYILLKKDNQSQYNFFTSIPPLYWSQAFLILGLVVFFRRARTSLK